MILEEESEISDILEDLTIDDDTISELSTEEETNLFTDLVNELDGKT